MYIKRNSEARLCDNYCSGKGTIVTYTKYVFVALRIQHAMSMPHIVICGLPGCKIFFHFVS